MIRLLIGASLAAGAAGFILYQFQGTAELAFWEILLLLIVFFQYRAVPERGDPLSKPLFEVSEYNPARLPRTLASMELAVIDATTGYVTPDRRLRPVLQRIASHRLARHGLSIDSEKAAAAIGTAQMQTLTGSGESAFAVDELADLVQSLESL